MARQTKISRPAARKGADQQPKRRTATGATKPPKTRSSAGSGSDRKAESPVQVAEQTRRRFTEPPKVAGELPTPTATFYF